MRFRFFRPTNEGETEAHLHELAAMDAYWKDVVPELRIPRRGASEQAALQDALLAATKRWERQLVVEVEPWRAGICVVVAPSEDPGLDPFVNELLRRAPRVPGVEFRRHWPAAPADIVVGLAGSRFGVDFADGQARAGFTRGHLLEVVVYSSYFESATDGAGLDAAQFLVTRLLGEERFDEWISSVDISPAPRSSSLRVISESEEPTRERFAVIDLPEVFSRAVDGLRAQFPPVPYHAFCERAEWTLLELQPRQGEDYAELEDLALCATMLPEMTKCFLQGERFSSTRFSNQHEHFCFLKVDGAGTSDEQRFEKRLALEEALNRALVPGRVGCVVGAGLGLRYVYLLLALQNLEDGITITRQIAQRSDAPRRSWIQFCDTRWRYEWVGIWDETPAPP